MENKTEITQHILQKQ